MQEKDSDVQLFIQTADSFNKNNLKHFCTLQFCEFSLIVLIIYYYLKNTLYECLEMQYITHYFMVVCVIQLI